MKQRRKQTLKICFTGLQSKQVLLIGERPGLVTAESLSAYMCYQPRTGRTDSDRMVISNIHRGGTPAMEAGAYIGNMLDEILTQGTSGIDFK